MHPRNRDAVSGASWGDRPPWGPGATLRSGRDDNIQSRLSF